jgi:NAD-dependent dihydropyrimidine dehydrogenase PreA subunit
MVKVEIDLNKCDGDGTCVDVCPVDVFELKELTEYE